MPDPLPAVFLSSSVFYTENAQLFSKDWWNLTFLYGAIEAKALRWRPIHAYWTLTSSHVLGT